MPNLGILQDVLERPDKTFDKRFMGKHYSYRDFHTEATGAVPVTYVFGTNARALSMYNWPRVNDWLIARNTYAREVFVYVTQDTWVRLVSLNPYYSILLNQLNSAAEITALGVPQYLTEVAQILPADEELTWYPAYGYAIIFYQVAAPGTIHVWVEGNVEGSE